MTTRNIALAVDTAAIPLVGALLAKAGITIGPVTRQTGQLRCFTAHYDHIPGLTGRDIRLLELIAEGLTMPAIARRMGFTDGTTRHMAKGLYRKLGADNRTHAVAIAYRMGVLNSWQEAAA